jgi:diguanylate cyclase (GGDEF)-like protein
VVVLDGLGDLVRERGAAAGDSVLVGAATLLRKHFDPQGGLVARLRDDAFVVIAPGAGHIGAVRIGTEFRADLERAGTDGSLASGGPARVTTSVGTAALEPASGAVFARVEQLIAAADRAAASAQAAGGNCVRAFVPKLAA